MPGPCTLYLIPHRSTRRPSQFCHPSPTTYSSVLHILPVPARTPTPALPPRTPPPIVPARSIPAPSLIRRRRSHKRVVDHNLLLKQLLAVALLDGASGFVERGVFDEDVALQHALAQPFLLISFHFPPSLLLKPFVFLLAERKPIGSIAFSSSGHRCSTSSM